MPATDIDCTSLSEASPPPAPLTLPLLSAPPLPCLSSSSSPAVSMAVSTFRLVHPAVYFFIAFGLTSLYLSASYPSMPRPVHWLQPVQDLAFLLMRNQTVMTVVFIARHLAARWRGGLCAARAAGQEECGRLGPAVVDGMQTLAVGYPSMRLLRAAARRPPAA